MFERLFSQSGLSLDRLRALVEVGARGSIVRAADNDPARQSLYSRQIKELEDYFQAVLVERYGKGIRLTAGGRELARISRFFLLGLSNFQRGCLAEGQTYRIGAGPTFLATFLVPLLAAPQRARSGVRFALEAVPEQEVERRLHDLTLDFGVVCRPELSRPLRTQELGGWRLELWVPRSLCKTGKQAAQAFATGRLPYAWAEGEMTASKIEALEQHEPALTCESFLDALGALEQEGLAVFLPDFLAPKLRPDRFLRVSFEEPAADQLRYRLAWNPRLLRLNLHAGRRRDDLIQSLSQRLKSGVSRRP